MALFEPNVFRLAYGIGDGAVVGTVVPLPDLNQERLRVWLQRLPSRRSQHPVVKRNESLVMSFFATFLCHGSPQQPGRARLGLSLLDRFAERGEVLDRNAEAFPRRL